MLTVCTRTSAYEQLAVCAKTRYCSFLLWYFYSLNLLTDRHLPRLALPPRLLLIMNTPRFWILLSQYRSSRVCVAHVEPASVHVYVCLSFLHSLTTPVRSPGPRGSGYHPWCCQEEKKRVGGEEEKSALMLYGHSAFFLKCCNVHGKGNCVPEVPLFLSSVESYARPTFV